MITDEQLISRFPSPLAKTYSLATGARESSASAEHFLRLFELAVQYAALVSLARCFPAGEARRDSKGLIGGLLNEPSLGGWVNLLRSLDREMAAAGQGAFGADLAEKSPERLPAFMALRRTLDNRDGSPKASLDEALSRITQLRNDNAHRRISIQALAGHLGQLQAAIEEILKAIPLYSTRKLVYVDAVNLRREGAVARMAELRGDGNPRGLPDVVFPLNACPLVERSVYLRSEETGEYVDLFPFVVSDGNEVYLFNGVGRSEQPQWSCSHGDVKPPLVEEANEELRRRFPFVFEQEEDEPEPGVSAAAPVVAASVSARDRFRDLVEVFADDGLVTAAEFRSLERKAREFDLALDREGVRELVLSILQEVSPEAQLAEECLERDPAKAPGEPPESKPVESPEPTSPLASESGEPGPKGEEEATGHGDGAESHETPVREAPPSPEGASTEEALRQTVRDARILFTLNDEETELLAAIPDDGQTIGNITVARALGWDQDKYFAVREGILTRGLIQTGRGLGGAVRRVFSDEERVFGLVPEDGTPIGNWMLERMLGWTEEKYWPVRTALVDRDLIVPGRGRGGSVRRS